MHRLWDLQLNPEQYEFTTWSGSAVLSNFLSVYYDKDFNAVLAKNRYN